MPRTSLRIALAAQAFLAACVAAQPAPPAKPEPPPPGPLPRDVRPLHYTLALQIDPDQPRFSGRAEIAIELTQPRQELFIHGRGLHVTESTADGAPAQYEQLTDDGVVRLSFPRALGPGRATLRFAWDAAFDPQLAGLYVAKEAGINYAFTQFEAVDARKAFPCFDDPAFKTPFDVTLTVPAAGVAVANTLPLEEKPVQAGLKSIRYAATLPLPTYLIAWAVGPFDVVAPPPLPPNEIRKRPLQVRGIAPKGRGPELAWALESGNQLLVELENWFGREFPYDKLDHIAVPDYSYGAMENAGAITYRETFLLFKEGASTADQKATIAHGIAHEIAHQWFGDLVTLRWWDDAWLNESFATWMDYKIVQGWNPAFLSRVEQLKDAGKAMGSDSLASARAIRQPVETNAEIGNAFSSSIAYWKGAAVLDMFERFVGPEKFQQAVRSYISSHANGSGSTDELLASISQAAGRDVGTPFHTFLDQPGVPLVEVRVSCAEKPRLLLKQSRYLPVGSEGDRKKAWQIPLCVRSSLGEQCTLLTAAEGAMDLAGCPRWLVPNADASGYYRWSLAREDLAKLSEAKLTLRERISLGQNLRAAVRSADLRVSDALPALEPLARDAEGPVATEPTLFLVSIARYLSDDTLPALRAYSASLYRDAYRRLGWDPVAGESFAQRVFRGAVVQLMLHSRDPQAVAEGARRGKAYLGKSAFDPRAVDPELAGPALQQYVRQGGAQAFDEVLARLEKTEESELRDRLLHALDATLDPKLAQRALDLGLDPRLRKNERFYVIGGLMGERETRALAWSWLQAHFDELAKAIPEQYAAAGPFFALGFCDADHLAQVQAFFGPRAEKIPSMPRNLRQAAESIKLCIAEASAQRADAESFFRRVAARQKQ